MLRSPGPGKKIADRDSVGVYLNDCNHNDGAGCAGKPSGNRSGIIFRRQWRHGYGEARRVRAKLCALGGAASPLLDVPHHVSGSREPGQHRADDQQGIRLQQGHHGRDLQRVHLVLRSVPGAGRLAGRSLWTAARAVRHHGLPHGHRHPDDAGDRLLFPVGHPLHARRGRGRRVSNRDARHADVVPAR